MVVETILNNPVYLGGVVAAGAGFAGVQLYKYFSDGETSDTIDTEGMTSRLKKIFVNPTNTQGSKVKDYIKQRAVSNTPQLIGFAVRAKRHSVNVLKWDSEDESFESDKVKGTTYTVIEGGSKMDIWQKRILNAVLPKDYTETHDVPNKHVIPGEDYIWYDPSVHLVKKNGVKRQMTPEGMGRVWDSSFALLHENFLETLEDIPEQYATLNNRISGQLKMENIKSENIKDYMESKNEAQGKDSMKS